jgi:hypothetical protein
MKKYLLGVIALILVVAFSSFTIYKHHKKPTQANLYWYTVVAGAYGTRQNNTPITKDDAMNGPAPITSCQDIETQPLCLAGSTSSNATGSVGSPDFEHRIKQSQ